MSTVAEDVQQIRSAIYGRDVREAIADGIEHCYSDVSSGVTTANTAANAANAAAQRANTAAAGAEGIPGTASLEDVNNLKSALTKYNSYNFLVPYPTEQSVYNGITWSWDGETCYYSGTSTGSTFYRLYWIDRTHMPEWMKLGETYWVEYKSTDKKASFNCIFYKNGDILSYSDYYLQSGFLTIPSDADGVQIRIFMNGNVTANGSVSVALLNNYSNADLAKQIKNVFPLYVPSGSTFSLWNDMPSPSYFNGYPTLFKDSIDAELDFNNNSTYQVIKLVNRIYITNPSANQLFLGQRGSNGVQYWVKTAVEGAVTKMGAVPAGSDLDSLIKPGYYTLASNVNYIHSPFPGYGGIIIVFPASDNQKLQIAVKNSTPPKECFRISHSGVFPEVWTEGGGNTYNGAVTKMGAVPAGSDLDSLIKPGYYWLSSDVNYIHSPFPGYGGIIIVFPASDNQILQIAVKNSTPPKECFRISHSGVFPEVWTEGGGNTYNNTYQQEHYENTYNITCSPVISTDTNNYLPSTNDTTDRTGDIQTLLNTTGVCNLGPGDFYITGVGLPSYGLLRGSGAKTRIILASNVTNGYAIKLGHYSCVKDLRIVGSTSSYTPSATVGNRHGILFEATGDASTNPTYKYNATVENCFIMDFDGGAITCNNSGISVDQCIEVCDCHIKRCDAGVNVAYRSEFHHFTNINATGCYYGCICNGGNCLFTNCNFSGNTVGILIDNSTGQSPNNAHGVFSCCKVAHSGKNAGIGIKVIGSDKCENFNGISFDYGHIVVENCKGVQFTGCRIGRETVFDITDSTATIFDACIIRDASSVTVNNSNSSTHFINCYNSVDGVLFNPLNE